MHVTSVCGNMRLRVHRRFVSFLFEIDRTDEKLLLSITKREGGISTNTLLVGSSRSHLLQKCTCTSSLERTDLSFMSNVFGGCEAIAVRVPIVCPLLHHRAICTTSSLTLSMLRVRPHQRITDATRRRGEERLRPALTACIVQDVKMSTFSETASLHVALRVRCVCAFAIQPTRTRLGLELRRDSERAFEAAQEEIPPILETGKYKPITFDSNRWQ